MADRKNQGSGIRVLVGLMVVGVVLTILAVAAVFALVDNTPSVDEGTVLEIVVDGAWSDAPVPDNPFAELGFGGGPSNSVWDVRRALREAASDDRIVGAFVTIRTPSMGFATRQVLVKELERFREQGSKPVHVLLASDFVDDNAYYLATGGSKIWATPEAWWMVNGLQADAEFYRGTLDKLEVKPEVIMFKEYKSAGETFRSYEMSEPMREALTAYLTDIFDVWVRDVAARRTMEPARVREAVDRGMLTGPAAVEVGFADELGYRDQVLDAFATEAGVDEVERMGLGKYLQGVEKRAVSGDRVAVIFANGIIVSAPGSDNPFAGSGMIHGPTVAEHIRKAAENDDVKAIVFRVNSPGGSAVGSDLIWRAIEQAQEAGKPVVVSMGDVAASGGYWVSMGSDAILAESGTITGSIGVVFTKLNLEGLWNLAGAQIDSVRLSENAGLTSPFESFTEEQYAQVEATIGSTYQSFVTKVAEGRGKEFGAIEPLAHGRVWSAEDALENGLVDAIGGLDDAIALAAEKADMGTEEPPFEVLPKQKDFFEQLMEGELGNVQQPLPLTRAQLEAWVREVSLPKVQALAPTIRIH